MEKHSTNIEAVCGRYAVNAFIVFFLFCTVVWNLPKSALKAALIRPIHRAVTLIGLEENFVTFAPNPPRREKSLHAVITYADGTHSQWKFTTGGQAKSISEYFALPHARSFWGHFLHDKAKQSPELITYILRESGAMNSQTKPVSVRLFVRNEMTSKLDPITGRLEIAHESPDKIICEKELDSSGITH